MKRQGSQRCCLSSTWTSCEANSSDWELAFVDILPLICTCNHRIIQHASFSLNRNGSVVHISIVSWDLTPCSLKLVFNVELFQTTILPQCWTIALIIRPSYLWHTVQLFVLLMISDLLSDLLSYFLVLPCLNLFLLFSILFRLNYFLLHSFNLLLRLDGVLIHVPPVRDAKCSSQQDGDVKPFVLLVLLRVVHVLIVLLHHNLLLMRCLEFRHIL